jgi:phage terminase large subunit GpA-like protein
VIKHDVVDGDPSIAATWDRFARVLFQWVDLADGRKMRISAACVDSGDGVLTQMVYRFTSQFEDLHVVSIKGRGGDLCPMFSAPSRRNAHKALLYVLGVDKIKEVIADRLNIRTVGPGYIHIPEALKDEYWAQLNAEKKEIMVERGRTVAVWKKLRERNEALDCAVYAFAAFELFCIGRRRASNIKAHTRRRIS